MSTQLCTFRAGELALGLDVELVQEVLRAQRLTRVPLAPRCVRGLINLRGQIVMAVDLGLALELGAGARRDGARRDGAPGCDMNVVLRGRSASLLVDEVGDVVDVPADARDQPPEHLPGRLARVVTSLCKVEGQLVLELDPAAVLAVVEGQRPRAQVND
ncbi:MAG: chemotaxis protein CheW [Planctomycetota bacterium]